MHALYRTAGRGTNLSADCNFCGGLGETITHNHPPLALLQLSKCDQPPRFVCVFVVTLHIGGQSLDFSTVDRNSDKLELSRAHTPRTDLQQILAGARMQ